MAVSPIADRLDFADLRRLRGGHRCRCARDHRLAEPVNARSSFGNPPCLGLVLGADDDQAEPRAFMSLCDRLEKGSCESDRGTDRSLRDVEVKADFSPTHLNSHPLAGFFSSIEPPRTTRSRSW